MRLRIRHETAYAYETPANRAIEILRLTPRGHDGQFIVDWRIDVDHDCRLDQSSDPFGNTVHAFTAEGPLSGLVIIAEGSIETSDTSGVLTGQIERFPPTVFLRDTTLTVSDAAIRDFARTIAGTSGPRQLDLMHDLMAGIRERLRFEVERDRHRHQRHRGLRASATASARTSPTSSSPPSATSASPPATSAATSAAADHIDQEAGHAWAEALIDGLGWVGFDPANGICPTDAYVRLAIGLDYLGAAPVRGTRYGGSGETLAVRVEVEDAGRGGR